MLLHLVLEDVGLKLIGEVYVSCILDAVTIFGITAALDVDKIAQTVDVQTLQENILNVTFCNVINEVTPFLTYYNYYFILIGVS